MRVKGLSESTREQLMKLDHSYN